MRKQLIFLFFFYSPTLFCGANTSIVKAVSIERKSLLDPRSMCTRRSCFCSKNVFCKYIESNDDILDQIILKALARRAHVEITNTPLLLSNFYLNKFLDTYQLEGNFKVIYRSILFDELTKKIHYDLEYDTVNQEDKDEVTGFNKNKLKFFVHAQKRLNKAFSKLNKGNPSLQKIRGAVEIYDLALSRTRKNEAK